MQGLGRVIWAQMMFLLAALITIVVFLAAVPPSDRRIGFYVWMAVLCGGEFVIFTWAINYRSSRHGRGISGATLQIIHLMMIWWFLIAVPVAAVGALTTWRSSQFHDLVAELLAILVFFFFLGATILYSKDLAIQAEERATEPERVELQVWATTVQQACDDLRSFASTHDDHAVYVERLVKKLDAIGTSLQHAPPGKIGVREEKGGRSVRQYNARIVALIEELRDKVVRVCASSEDISGRLDDLDQLLGRLESLLRQRQQFLLVGGAH